MKMKPQILDLQQLKAEKIEKTYPLKHSIALYFEKPQFELALFYCYSRARALNRARYLNKVGTGEHIEDFASVIGRYSPFTSHLSSVFGGYV